MSIFIFTATDEYKNRVIQLGENPNRVLMLVVWVLKNIKIKTLI